jgi:hypothetical protein
MVLYAWRVVWGKKNNWFKCDVQLKYKMWSPCYKSVGSAPLFHIGMLVDVTEWVQYVIVGNIPYRYGLNLLI